MKKLIAIFCVVVGVYALWHVIGFLQSSKTKGGKLDVEEETVVVPQELAGLPSQLAASLDAAQKQGPEALGVWLQQYSHLVADPRRAWIELDYVVLVTKRDPAKARQMYAQVRDRVAPGSPVYDRVQRLKKTYE